MARTFILNYYGGVALKGADFEKTETTPISLKKGQEDDRWDEMVSDGDVWDDEFLETAASEYFELIKKQREWFRGKKKAKRDRPEKALNNAVLSAWAFVAGLLQNNPKRLKRHFDLKKSTGRDPFNSEVLDKGRHKTDDDNYRGLGFRTDAKERGRFVELFYIQAEKGKGVTSAVVKAAIANYHAKQANLEAIKAKESVE